MRPRGLLKRLIQGSSCPVASPGVRDHQFMLPEARPLAGAGQAAESAVR